MTLHYVTTVTCFFIFQEIKETEKEKEKEKKIQEFKYTII